MKNLKLSLIVIGLLACGFTLGGKVHWTWQEQSIFIVAKDGKKLELGLRDDGIVVWREITQTTNSPAEVDYSGANLTVPYFASTNIILNTQPYNNMLWQSTNIIITH